MRKRILSIFTVLCFVVLGMVAISPVTSATASPTWPIEVPGDTIQTINAGDNGQLSLLSCHSDTGQNSTLQAQLMDANTGTVRSRLDSYQNLHQFCEPGYGYEADVNGIFYTYYPTTSTTSMFYAWKNGRQLWSTDISSGTNCSTSGTNKNMHPSSMSIGADGNVWMILTASWSGGGVTCGDRLVAVNPSDGSIVHNITLSAGSSGGISFNGSLAWTYSSYVLVIDRDSELHKFNYSGTEITNSEYPYTFTPGTGRTDYLFAANSVGTVYAASHSGSGAEAVDYHKDNGTAGTISNGIHPSGAVTQYSFDHTGNFIAIQVTTMDVFDISSGTVVAKTPINSGGYTYAVISDYVEDSSGNALVLWYYLTYSPTVSTKVAVSYIDGSTGTSTELLSESGNGTARPSPLNIGGMSGMDRSIADNKLYVSLCRDQSSGCGSTGGPADSWIYEVDLSGTSFGTPVKHTYGQNGYTSTKLQYVAMGDSYSSGEGNPPFLTDGNNSCDRSTSAYPYLLESLYGLNYKLVDHVACAGAMTNNVLNGQNNEPAQTNALTDNTALVTITIGGNDAGFSNFAYNCIFSTCGPGSPAYGLSSSAISDPAFETNLETVYETVLDKAPNAQVYVVGYPYVTPVDSSDPSCLPFNDPTPGSGMTDSMAARSIVDQLNTRSYLAVNSVNSARLHFVDPTQTGNEFDGHDICSTSPDFVYPQWTPLQNWAHPNAAGQLAYADLLAAAIG